MKLSRIALTAAAALMAAQSAFADNGKIFEGIADIPRLDTTGPVDGCAKTTKGLINNGGFLLFTCEKLLPYLPISAHEPTFASYQDKLAQDGWSRKSKNANKAKFVKTDAFGCEAHLEMTLWKDRSMNEGARPATDREAHRQIVFMAKFYGAACDRHYPTAQSLASQVAARP